MSQEECPKKRALSKRCNRKGTSCFHCKQESHLVHDCPQKKCVDVRSRGPEQSSALVTHLASDRIDGTLSKGVTERLDIAEGRIVELEGRLLEAETLEVQLRQQVVSLQAGQEQMRVQGEELHMVYLLTYPLHPQWDIRPQQCFATTSCLLLRPHLFQLGHY